MHTQHSSPQLLGLVARLVKFFYLLRIYRLLSAIHRQHKRIGQPAAGVAFDSMQVIPLVIGGLIGKRGNRSKVYEQGSSS